MDYPSSISEQEIRDQLRRILAFPLFSSSNLLSGFLSFIVRETLEGRGLQLKEYTVGVMVLSKKNGYDTKEDAAVRVHAGRLRKILAAYYEGPGRKDKILIQVPKGSYVPKFELNIPDSFILDDQQSYYFKPSLAILPFHYYDKKRDFALVDGLCDQLSTALTDFSELSVVSYFSTRQIAERAGDLSRAALLLDANYILTGNIQSTGNQVRIGVQLVVSKTLQQIWAFTYEKERLALDTFALQDDIIKHVVNQIAGSHGIIFREAAKKVSAKKILDIKVYDAVFWYYYLNSELSEALFHKALNSMKDAVKLDPDYAQGWAILAETYVAGNFYSFDCFVDDPLSEAVTCGKHALQIDTRAHYAYQALALAYLFMHRPKDCLHIVDRWIKLRSNSAGIAGGLGFCLISAGEYERGYLMLSESIQLNPYYQWWFNAGLSIYHFQKKEYDESIYWAEKMHYHSRPWELILKTASRSEAGNIAEARSSFNELLSIIPSPHELEKIIGSFIQSKELVDRLKSAVFSLSTSNAVQP